MIPVKTRPRRDPSATYDYPQLAERIEAVLGVRPALSTLRTATARATRAQDYPPRITAGMPAPLQPRTSPARFRAEDIESWLQTHPWRLQKQALMELTAAAATLDEAAATQAVAAARVAGASWSAVTEALQRGGWTIRRARVYQLFREMRPEL